MVCFPLIKWSEKNVTNLQICTYLKRKNKGTHDTFCLAFFFQAVYYMTCSESVIRHACERHACWTRNHPCKENEKVNNHLTVSVNMFHTIRHCILHSSVVILYFPFFLFPSPLSSLRSWFIILHSWFSFPYSQFYIPLPSFSILHANLYLFLLF